MQELGDSIGTDNIKNEGKNASELDKTPKHLTEFQSFLNNSIKVKNDDTANLGTKIGSRETIGRPPSIDTFTSFSPSVTDLGCIITGKEFKGITKSYEEILEKATKLRKALVEASSAASEFGNSLENVINDHPKVSNMKSVCNGIINGGSLQHVIGANQDILSKLISENFEIPLKKELAKLREEYASHLQSYQQEIKSKSKKLRQRELENIKIYRSKTRNLNLYKNNLMNLTGQIDEIDRFKYDFYQEVNAMIESFNKELLTRTGSLVRAELEVYEGIAKKGWTGGGLDDLLEISPDIFTPPDSDFNNGRMDEDRTANETMRSSTIYPQMRDSIRQPTFGSLNQKQSSFPTSPENHLVHDFEDIDNKIEVHSTPIETNHQFDNDNLEQSFDESFSLPIVDNSNGILSQSRSSKDAASAEDATIDGQGR